MPQLSLEMPFPIYIDNRQEREAKRLLDELMTLPIVPVDSETTGLDIARDVVVFWSVATNDRRWCLSSDVLHLFKPLFEREDLILVGHNLYMYDYHVFRNSGIRIRSRIHDTMVLNILTGQSSRRGSNSLKDIVRNTFGRRMPEYAEFFGKMDIRLIQTASTTMDLKTELSPEERQIMMEEWGELKALQEQLTAKKWLLQAEKSHWYWQKLFLDTIDYASRDAWETLQVYNYLKYGRGENEPGLTDVILYDPDDPEGDGGIRTLWDHFLEYEEPYSKLLAEITHRGVQVDSGHLLDLQEIFQGHLDRILRSFVAAAGDTINLNSVPQLRKFFFERLGKQPIKWTEGGASGNRAPSTDEDVVKIWASQGCDFSKMLLDYRKFGKLRSTYVEGLLERLDPDDRVHTRLIQNEAATNRLASRDPNLQNIPNRSEEGKWIRAGFIPTPGMIFIDADYAQLEMRIIADFSGDENMIHVITAGMDLHCYTVSLVDGIEYDLVKKAVKRCDGICCKHDGIPHKRGDDGSVKQWVCPVCNEIYPTADDKLLKKRRGDLKATGFGILYGIGPVKLGKDLGLPVSINTSRNGRTYEVCPDGTALINAYFGAYPGVKQWVDNIHDSCARDGFVQTFLRQYRWIDEIGSSERSKMMEAQRQAQNCLDAETEALTKRGWVKGFDLRKTDILLTKNEETGLLEWQPMTDLKLFPDYEGPLVEFSSKTFSAVSNPDHRWLVRDKRSGKDSCRTTADLVRRADGGGDLKIHRTGHYPGVDQPKPNSVIGYYPDDFVELVGWVMTDGWYGTGSNEGKVYISQSQRANPEKVRRIDELFERAGIKCGSWEGKSDECVRWSFSGDPSLLVRKRFPTKQLDEQFFCELTHKQLELLLDTMMLADGTGWDDEEQRGHLRFHTVSEYEADNFQILATLCGYASNKIWRDMSEYDPKSDKLKNVPHCDGYWVVTLLRRKYTQLDRHQVREFYSKQPIWCPIVPNTYFVARRKGKVFITGNTPIQGTAADICKAAMLRCHEDPHLRYDLGCKMLLQVHDEILFEMPKDPEAVEEACTIIKEHMENPFEGRWYPREFRVPLIAEVKTGMSWASAH